MSRPRVLAVLSVLLAGAAVLAVPAPASAASRVLSYTCEASGVPVGMGDVVATASWDTPIGENVVIDEGDSIHLMPLTGSLSLPAELIDNLRAGGFTDLSGDGGITLTVTETGAEILPAFAVGPVPLPGTGAATLEVTGVLDRAISGMTDPVEFDEPGTHTLVVTHFGIAFGLGTNGPQAGLICQLQDTRDTAVDRFLVRAAPEPTDAVAGQGEPVRPVLVQTDFAGEAPTSAWPAALGGVLLAACAALVAVRPWHRPGSRQDL